MSEILYEDDHITIVERDDGSLDAYCSMGGPYERPGWPDLPTAARSLLAAYEHAASGCIDWER